MKKIIYVVFLASLLSVFACTKNDDSIKKDKVEEPKPDDTDDNKDPDPKDESSFIIKLDKREILSDNSDKVSFKALFDNQLVNAKTYFFIDGKKIYNDYYKTSVAKEYTVYATMGDKKTNEIKFSAVATKKDMDIFTNKVLAEDYTGTWCGWCPRFISSIEKYEENPNFIPVAVHDDNDMPYVHVKSMMTKYGVDSYPTVVVNRSKKMRWQGDDPAKYIKKYSVVSIGLKTAISGSNAIIDVKLNFDKTYNFDNKLKLVVLLLEDDIIADQANYLSGKAGYESNRFYSLPNPVIGFKHMHVLRTAASDIYGDEIPAENTKNYTEYIKNYSIDISKYKADKCNIVAVVVQDDEDTVLGALNAQRVKLGESILF